MGHRVPIHITTQSYAIDTNYSHYTDLMIHDGVLFATTRFDGNFEAWDISGSGLSRFDTASHRRADVAGSDVHLISAVLNGQDVIIASGGASNALQYIKLRDNGDMHGRNDIGYVPLWGGDIGDMASVTLASGETVIYGAITTGGGIGSFTLQPDATLVGTDLHLGLGAGSGDTVVAVEVVSIGGAEFLLSLSDNETGFSTWVIGAAGGLTQTDSVDPQRHLWITAPTALATAQVGDETYAILAAAGSASLTVARITGAGAIEVTDHVLDNGYTRFDDVQAVATARYGDLTYVVAGGSDGGISVFVLGPDGRLYEQGSLADSAATAMAHVSAIEVAATASGLDIFVASSSEFGITRLHYDLDGGGNLIVASTGGSLSGTAGTDFLFGGEGNDALSGGAGGDILVDGAGVDSLTGGAGSDTFVFVADGQADRVTDFDPNADRLDLSQWSMLRDPSDLTVTGIANGFRIIFGDETLDVLSEDWGTTTIQSLAHNLILGVDRVDLDNSDSGGSPTGPFVNYGTSGDDILVAPDRPSHLYGGEGDDLVIGSSEDDELYGDAGADTIYGQGGNDVIHGGAGDDIIYLGDGWGDPLA